jgi:hypothetical protein
VGSVPARDWSTHDGVLARRFDGSEVLSGWAISGVREGRPEVVSGVV